MEKSSDAADSSPTPNLDGAIPAREFGFGDDSLNNFQAIDYDCLAAALIAQH